MSLEYLSEQIKNYVNTGDLNITELEKDDLEKIGDFVKIADKHSLMRTRERKEQRDSGSFMLITEHETKCQQIFDRVEELLGRKFKTDLVDAGASREYVDRSVESVIDELYKFMDSEL